MVYGAIVATACLAGFFQVERQEVRQSMGIGHTVHRHLVATNNALPGFPECVPVTPWGDYSIGRWIWQLSHVQALSEPIPAKGAQRIWYLDAQTARECAYR